MVPDLSEINLAGDYEKLAEKDQSGKPRTRFLKAGNTFLVVNQNTFEVRCDPKLSQLLQEKYESVMQSRYFGHAGIEIIPSSQLTPEERADLIRLSFNLS